MFFLPFDILLLESLLFFHKAKAMPDFPIFEQSLDMLGHFGIKEGKFKTRMWVPVRVFSA
jgi:hypothetical protein